MRGLPRFPSSEFIIAVSSPQMYAAAHPRVFDELHDFSGLHRERLLERSVAAARAPAIEADGLALAEVLRENERLSLVRLVRKTHVSRVRREARAPSRR